MTGGPPTSSAGPVWRDPKNVRYDDAHAYNEQRRGPLRARITAKLERLMTVAYAITP